MCLASLSPQLFFFLLGGGAVSEPQCRPHTALRAAASKVSAKIFAPSFYPSRAPRPTPSGQPLHPSFLPCPCPWQPKTMHALYCTVRTPHFRRSDCDGKLRLRLIGFISACTRPKQGGVGQHLFTGIAVRCGEGGEASDATPFLARPMHKYCNECLSWRPDDAFSAG